MTKPRRRPREAGSCCGFDGLQAGGRGATATITLTARMMDAFAALTGYRFAIHMDAWAARRRALKGRVAHGLLGQSPADGLKNLTPAQSDAIAPLGWHWDFREPVIAGDSVRAVIGVAGKRTTSNPVRGIAALPSRVPSQRNATVQTGICPLMISGRRPAPPGA